MITRINIRNIALIEELSIEFNPGFSVLTGETGAGKSILIDSMNLALGERADRELVRAGAERASVEAEFDIRQNPRALKQLEDMGVSAKDGRVIVVRELTMTGRNSVRVNGMPQPLAALRRLTSLMVDLHGQHEHQSLLDEERHVELLDVFAGKTMKPLTANVAACYVDYRKAVGELTALSGDSRVRVQRIDMLRFQVEEIDAARLQPDEENRLLVENEKLRNAEKIAQAIASARALLSGGERSRGAVSSLNSAAQHMRAIQNYDEAYAALAARIEDAAYSMQDVALDISTLAEEEELDPHRIDYVERRLDELRTLRRKYGDDIASVLQYREHASEELNQLEHGEEYAKELDAKISALRRELVVACGRLSIARMEAASRYNAELLGHLSELGMVDARFLIEVEVPDEGFEEERFSANGFDRVRFLFSANAGEPVRPLARIASGGEISRVMLAIKSVSAGEVGCLIFDEIDTGVSGRMAQMVGEKIARIAQNRQIICVTHLPQIACMADKQYIVFKLEEQGRAGTRVQELDAQGRVDEIARLVGGADGFAAARDHAASMLCAAAKRRGKL